MMTLEDYITKYGEEDGTKRWKHNEKGKLNYENNKSNILERQRLYYHQNANHRNETIRLWQTSNPNKVKSYIQRWNNNHPKERRAINLVCSYKKEDIKYNRGECTLTAQWILDNIFSRSCLYCGETDWHLLGCDRKNNTKPHTPDNVVCCCKDCNNKRQHKDFLTFALSIGAKESEDLVIRY